jgi:two-component system response regulator HydG
MSHAFKILIVDDEQNYCDVLKMILEAENYFVISTTKATHALELLERENFDLVLSDFFMQDMDGFELLREIKKDHIDTEVIIITGYGSIKNAVEAMKVGAFSYYIKSHDPEELLFEIAKVKRIAELKLKIVQPAVSGQYLMHSKNDKMKKAVDLIDKIANSPANILLLGESGVGKEAFAAYIHQKSGRNENNFVPVNCHAYSKTLLESELFGHEKGAYTGATETRIGKFESAEGGTLFLDEIGDATVDMQLKMLRVLDTKRIERIGSNKLIDVDFRLVCATNRSLSEMIREGHFREDFYYRISTFVVDIPPLRERREDLVAMVHFFVSKLAHEMKKSITKVDEDLMLYLMHYDYPGNIRELKNIIERLIVLSPDGILRKSDLYLDHKSSKATDLVTLKSYRKNSEREYIQSVLTTTGGHLTKSSEILGITRRQLFNLIQEHQLKT